MPKSRAVARRHRRKKERLDKGLNIRKLSLCVPKSCYENLMGDIKPETDCPIPGEDGTGGWLLRGTQAITYARRLQETIHRRALRIKQVTAVDVGFGVAESERKFINVLAIRLHVSKELEKEALSQLGDVRFIRAIQESANPDRALKKEISTFLAQRLLPEKMAVKRSDYLKAVPFRKVTMHPDQENEEYSAVDCDQLKEASYLCRPHLCGVPIYTIEARYFPSSGVFVDPPQTSCELKNEEALYTGRRRINTLVGGISIGNSRGQAGTLGAVVWDRRDGSPCVLSNYHILAGSRPARMGQPCYQPAIFDGGSADNVIANLKRWRLDEDGDVAIAELNGSRAYASGEVLGLWHPIAGIEEPKLGMTVRKFGRTTGFTEGFIDGIDLATNIQYGPDETRFFKGQIHLAPLYRDGELSQVGDSGSLIVVSRKIKRIEEAEEKIEAANRSEKKTKEFIDALRSRLDQTLLKEPDQSPPNPQARQTAESKLAECEQRVQSLLDLVKEFVQEDRKNARLEATPNVVAQITETPGGANENCDPPPLDWLRESLEKLNFDLPINQRWLKTSLQTLGFNLEELEASVRDKRDRATRRAYYAVGLLFAGDTAGSAFGEFALASTLETLAENLEFSIQPVFEPWGSFREVRNLPELPPMSQRSNRPIPEPGDRGPDKDPGGPQPDPKAEEPPPGG